MILRGKNPSLYDRGQPVKKILQETHRRRAKIERMRCPDSGVDGRRTLEFLWVHKPRVGPGFPMARRRVISGQKQQFNLPILIVRARGERWHSRGATIISAAGQFGGAKLVPSSGALRNRDPPRETGSLNPCEAEPRENSRTRLDG